MIKNTSKTIILASASPRRRELLKTIGLKFKIIPSDIDETEINAKNPEELVRVLACKKAEDIAKKTTYPAIVIGADTIVIINNMLLGKPTDTTDAVRMLNLLSGKKHTVISGIAVIDTESKKVSIESVSSEVYFKELTENEINNYIKTGEPMDKAGAYAIQGVGSIFITHIHGCYSNIVGLPIHKLAQMLKEFQVNILTLNTVKHNK